MPSVVWWRRGSHKSTGGEEVAAAALGWESGKVTTNKGWGRQTDGQGDRRVQEASSLHQDKGGEMKAVPWHVGEAYSGRGGS